MSPVFLIHPPAKINLFLEVLGRRSDGYHEIETLMTAITLSDTLCFQSRSDGEIRLICDWERGARSQRSLRHGALSSAVRGDLPEEKSNLVYRAAQMLRRQAHVSAGASLWLVKRIPSSAGLGGASSDAAATLLVANHAWGLRWPLERLAPIATELGSDVPFFLRAGAAVCRGRGEVIEPTTIPKLWLVVARPATGLSTPEVYRHCRPSERPVGAAPLLTALRRNGGVGVGLCLKNDLQAAAERLSPEILRLARELTRLAAGPVQMSGSGSSFFAICRGAAHARHVANRLRQRGEWAVWTAASTAERPIGREISEEGALSWKLPRFASS